MNENFPTQNKDEHSDNAREAESEAREKVISEQIGVEEYLAELNKICAVGLDAESELTSFENAFVHYKDAYERLLEVASSISDTLIETRLEELRTKLKNLIAQARDAGDDGLANTLQGRFDRINQ